MSLEPGENQQNLGEIPTRGGTSTNLPENPDNLVFHVTDPELLAIYNQLSQSASSEGLSSKFGYIFIMALIVHILFI